MSRLEELIEQLCPDGVRMVELGTFAKVEIGKNKNCTCNRAYSITQKGLIPTSEYFKEAKVTSEDTSGYKIVKKHWFVYSPSRIDVGSINYLQDEEDVIVSPLNVVFSVNENVIDVKYLLTFLNSRKGTWQILSKREGIEGTGRKMLPFAKFATIEVPIPPMQVQQEIVRILDQFTELTAELTARKKQYEHYRDKLLTFKEREA
ncbi:restriction endonuclease subunit S [Pseudoflavonifractor capillosus]|nr:restriction endonuclease subunit S [Pseudoflavonifractor capillosus]MBM6897409.1 restriction endonuclease subunit S [Pseudoflavonifractor capillosus]